MESDAVDRDVASFASCIGARVHTSKYVYIDNTLLHRIPTGVNISQLVIVSTRPFTELTLSAYGIILCAEEYGTQRTIQNVSFPDGLVCAGEKLRELYLRINVRDGTPLRVYALLDDRNPAEFNLGKLLSRRHTFHTIDGQRVKCISNWGIASGIDQKS